MDKIVRVVNLPTTVRGFTIPDVEGNYNIYINSNLSYEMQVETYIHETAHVDNDDFYSERPITVAEIMGHSVSVMREIYTHITNERRKNTSIKMNNLYKLRVVKKGCEKYKKISYNKDKLTISGK